MLCTLIIVSGLPIFIRQLKRSTVVWILACYIAAVLIVTLGVRTFDNETHIVLNPIKTHILFIRSASIAFQENGLVGLWNRIGLYYEKVLRTFLLNILLFIPLGYLLPLVYTLFRRWWKVLLLGFSFSLLIETTQLLTGRGWFDASDLLHNSFGAIIGFWIYLRWWQPKEG